MRNYWTIIPLFFYILASSGLNVNLHYCHDQLASISIVYDADCCCSKESENDCCENQNLKVSQVDFDVLLKEEADLDIVNWSSIVRPSLLIEQDHSYVFSKDEHYYIDRKPPDQKIYLQLSRLVYYG